MRLILVGRSGGQTPGKPTKMNGAGIAARRDRENTMRTIFKVSLGLVAMGLGSAAMAQINGPVPLAWRWQASTRGSVPSTPAVDGDLIYQNLGGRIFCLDKNSGSQKWKYPNVDPIEGTFRTSPLVAGDIVVAFSDNKVVYGIDKNTGETKWTHPIEGALLGQPIMAGRFIAYKMASDQVMIIDALTGAPGWETPWRVLDGISGGLAYYQNALLYFNQRSEIVSLNMVSKASNYRKKLGSVTIGASPVVFGDNVLINSGQYLVSLGAATGSRNWERFLRFQLQFSPTLSGSNIFVCSADGGVLALDANGNPLMKAPIQVGSTLAAPPLAVGSKVIVPVSAGGMVLVDLNGSILWDYSIKPNPEYKVAANTSNNNGMGGGMGAGAGAGGGIGGGGGMGGGGAEGVTPPTVAPSATPILAGETLLVPSRDGTLLAFDKNLGADLTAPKVSMIFPNPGDQVNGQPPLLLWFKIEDDASGIRADTLNVDVDGQKLDCKLEKTGYVFVRFTLTAKNRPLSDGRKTITVSIADWLGNTRKSEFALTIDNSLPLVRLPGSQPGAGGPGGPGGPPGGGKGGFGSG